MRATEAIFLWTPNRDEWIGHPTRGHLHVTTVSEAHELKFHLMSVGACEPKWGDEDDAGRRKLMQRYITQMIHRDGLDPETVLQAVQQVEDFRDLTFSTEAPDPDDDSWR